MRKRDGRIVASAVLGVALLAASTTNAGAADDPAGGLLEAAEKILATATSGDPLKVVTTTRTSGAPQITTEVAPNRSQALDLIISGLRKSSTIGVDIAHEVSIDASNDTYRSKQWALTRFDAETAWKTSTGSGVTVAVIDTGVQAGHADLSGHILSGRDYVAPGTSATDENGHGTHVAGIITAISNNRRGIAGLAPKTKVLPVRVLDRAGVGDSANVAKGIIWAVDRGAKVINLSLSSSQADSAGRAAVAYAISKNVVVVAAAGNDGCAFLFGSPRTLSGRLRRGPRGRRDHLRRRRGVVLQLWQLGRRRRSWQRHRVDHDSEAGRQSGLPGELLHALGHVDGRALRGSGRGPQDRQAGLRRQAGHGPLTDPVDRRRHRRQGLRHELRLRCHQPAQDARTLVDSVTAPGIS